MDAKLKYTRSLKIGNVALYQERTILIVSKFQYTQCIGSRPVKLKPISRGISSEWYSIFVSYNFIVWNKPARLCTCKYVLKCPNNTSECKHRWNTPILSDPFQCKREMAFFFSVNLFQMTYLGVLYEWDKIWKFQNQLYSLRMNIKATRKNVTNDFRINSRYVFVHAKTSLSLECHKM